MQDQEKKAKILTPGSATEEPEFKPLEGAPQTDAALSSKVDALLEKKLPDEDQKDAAEQKPAACPRCGQYHSQPTTAQEFFEILIDIR